MQVWGWSFSRWKQEQMALLSASDTARSLRRLEPARLSNGTSRNCWNIHLLETRSSDKYIDLTSLIRTVKGPRCDRSVGSVSRNSWGKGRELLEGFTDFFPIRTDVHFFMFYYDMIHYCNTSIHQYHARITVILVETAWLCKPQVA